MSLDNNVKGTVEFDFKTTSPENNYSRLRNVPFDQLVPRLHYRPKETPDDFDYYNLMMAEFSRNGVSMPFGREGDDIAHFETDLKAAIPWLLEEDYKFKPNPYFKPLRFSIVNNCLSSGLWELNATDKTGEIYHGWMNFPKDEYFNMVAEVNGLEADKVRQALQWKEDKVNVDLDRLSTQGQEIATLSASVIDEPISYSTQGSRQKLSKKFVTCKQEDNYKVPHSLSEVINNPVKMCAFVEPGLYSLEERKDFDFQFLGEPQAVRVYEVDPKTSYSFNKKPFKRDEYRYVEIQIDLPNKRKLIVGNLPLHLMVQQEDFGIHGFGVGILSPGGFAERRQFLIDQGFHPTYTYLVEETEEGLVALNSHDLGLEQVFIRSFATSATPHWDITFTSYERITDIVKYRIPIPDVLLPAQIAHKENYITPVYFSYRDDNIR